jgi:hypothetical protein
MIAPSDRGKYALSWSSEFNATAQQMVERARLLAPRFAAREAVEEARRIPETSADLGLAAVEIV